MTIYQELQLDASASKRIIQNAKNSKEKFRHIAIYTLKIILTLAFCISFVLLYSTLFGSENSILGVSMLLFVLVFRFSHLGIRTSNAIPCLLVIFAILAFSPHLANTSNVFVALLIHLVSIFVLMFLGCHHVILSNQSTILLSYILLNGYDVTGPAYTKRLEGIALGALLTCIIYYRNHRKAKFKRDFSDLFREFWIHSTRTKWQLAMAIGVSTTIFFASLMNLERTFWAGIASMSVIYPFPVDTKKRLAGRLFGNILGCILFPILYMFLPKFLSSNLGLIGGIGVALSVTYGWQSMFNSFGALAVAVGIFGVPSAIFYRLMNNLFGAFYALGFNIIFHKIMNRLAR